MIGMRNRRKEIDRLTVALFELKGLLLEALEAIAEIVAVHNGVEILSTHPKKPPKRKATSK